jgi:hypothetical protein
MPARAVRLETIQNPVTLPFPLLLDQARPRER